jgi:hypothetical protein
MPVVSLLAPLSEKESLSTTFGMVSLVLSPSLLSLMSFHHNGNFFGLFQQRTGNLGPTSTDFEESCKKSARNIGIDHPEPGETVSGAVHGTRHVEIHGQMGRLMFASLS